MKVISILQKKASTVADLCKALREVREQIPVLERQKEECSEGVIDFHVKALSGQGDKAELRNLQAKALDAEQRLVAINRVEKDLMGNIKAALEKDRANRLDKIDGEMQQIKKEKGEYETRAILARAQLSVILDHINPGHLESLSKSAWDTPEKREMFQTECERVRKELKIDNQISLDAQKTKLFSEADELRKAEFSDDYIEGLLIEDNDQCTARSAS